MRLRWHACPFPEVASEVPPTGRIVDVGCGHGLLALHLAAGSSSREVIGLDIDDAKLAAARAAAAVHPALDNVTFSSADRLGDLDGPAAAITVVDMLYLLDRVHQEALVQSLAQRLAPGGRLVIKEMAPTPRWKHRWMRAEEIVATRVARITASNDGVLCFTAPAEMRRWMTEAGLEVDERAVDGGRPYPHHLVVGRATWGAAGGRGP